MTLPALLSARLSSQPFPQFGWEDRSAMEAIAGPVRLGWISSAIWIAPEPQVWVKAEVTGTGRRERGDWWQAKGDCRPTNWDGSSRNTLSWHYCQKQEPGPNGCSSPSFQSLPLAKKKEQEKKKERKRKFRLLLLQSLLTHESGNRTALGCQTIGN